MENNNKNDEVEIISNKNKRNRKKNDVKKFRKSFEQIKGLVFYSNKTYEQLDNIEFLKWLLSKPETLSQLKFEFSFYIHVAIRRQDLIGRVLRHDRFILLLLRDLKSCELGINLLIYEIKNYQKEAFYHLLYLCVMVIVPAMKKDNIEFEKLDTNLRFVLRVLFSQNEKIFLFRDIIKILIKDNEISVKKRVEFLESLQDWLKGNSGIIDDKPTLDQIIADISIYKKYVIEVQRFKQKPLHSLQKNPDLYSLCFFKHKFMAAESLMEDEEYRQLYILEYGFEVSVGVNQTYKINGTTLSPSFLQMMLTFPFLENFISLYFSRIIKCWKWFSPTFNCTRFYASRPITYLV